MDVEAVAVAPGQVPVGTGAAESADGAETVPATSAAERARATSCEPGTVHPVVPAPLSAQ